MLVHTSTSVPTSSGVLANATRGNPVFSWKRFALSRFSGQVSAKRNPCQICGLPPGFTSTMITLSRMEPLQPAGVWRAQERYSFTPQSLCEVRPVRPLRVQVLTQVCLEGCSQWCRAWTCAARKRGNDKDHQRNPLDWIHIKLPLFPATCAGCRTFPEHTQLHCDR